MKIPSLILTLAVGLTGLAGAAAFSGCGSVGGYAEVDDGGYYGPGVVDPGFYGGASYGEGYTYGHPRGWANNDAHGARPDDHKGGARPASAPPMPHQARPQARPAAAVRAPASAPNRQH